MTQFFQIRIVHLSSSFFILKIPSIWIYPFRFQHLQPYLLRFKRRNDSANSPCFIVQQMNADPNVLRSRI
ncbi:hypothetical protein DUGA6_60950 [Duganella sp. HH105]|nr:hypothetical protein DUGA6_60950 [Duganella sp. HH105]